MLGAGIGWAEEFHMVALGSPGEGVIEVLRVEHRPQAVSALVARIAGLEPDRQSREPMVSRFPDSYRPRQASVQVGRFAPDTNRPTETPCPCLGVKGSPVQIRAYRRSATAGISCLPP